MIISSQCPAIYKKLHEQFGVEWDRGLIITYAPAVHSKETLEKFPEKIVHESVHLEQQGDDPMMWWSRYLTDKQFRLEQEIDAYGAEVRWIRKNVKDRNKRMVMIQRISVDLSSKMYGEIITQSEALSLFMKMKL